MFDIIGGLLSGIGGLFGDSESSSFEQWQESTTNAEGQDLNDELLGQLEDLFGRTLSTDYFTTGMDATLGNLQNLQGIAQQPRFNVDDFVNGLMQQAGMYAGLDLESGINGTVSQAGGSATGNSMAALLSNKMRNQTAANLAGIGANARKAGEEMRLAQDAFLNQAITGNAQQLMQGLLGLTAATRGAYKKGTSETKSHTWGNTNGSSGGGLGGFFSGLGGAFGGFNDARMDA